MLTIWGAPSGRLCNGVTRRSFLAAGTLGVAGLTLAGILRMRAQAGTPARSSKAVIMVYLGGGPSHIDMYDMKPDAPVEIRGEFRPIRTNVPGMDICELLPLQARIADKLAIVRNMRFTEPSHSAYEFLTGFPRTLDSTVFAGVRNPDLLRPEFGSVVSRMQAGNGSRLPRYVTNNTNFGPLTDSGASYLGAAHNPFFRNETAIANANRLPGMTLERLADRKALLHSFDSVRREVDANGALDGMDAFTTQALEMIGSTEVRDAFDISREAAPVRAKYGPHTVFLSARRLAEAGVAVVNIGFLGWDHHGIGDNGGALAPAYRNTNLPQLDHALHALVTDIHERGLENDIAVVVAGEMGRTPRVNNIAGRGHWPQAGFALLAGGGFKMGQVIGATDAHGALAVGAPYTPQNLMATLYGLFGIDTRTIFRDRTGRPHTVLDNHAPIAELV